MVVADQMTVSFPQLRVCDLPATNESSMMNSRSDRNSFISKNEGKPIGGHRYSVSYFVTFTFVKIILSFTSLIQNRHRHNTKTVLTSSSYFNVHAAVACPYWSWYVFCCWGLLTHPLATVACPWWSWYVFVCWRLLTSRAAVACPYWYGYVSVAGVC